MHTLHLGHTWSGYGEWAHIHINVQNTDVIFSYLFVGQSLQARRGERVVLHVIQKELFGFVV